MAWTFPRMHPTVKKSSRRSRIRQLPGLPSTEEEQHFKDALATGLCAWLLSVLAALSCVLQQLVQSLSISEHHLQRGLLSLC